MTTCYIRFSAVPLMLVLAACIGCQEQAREPVTRPSEQAETAPPEAVAEAEAQPEAVTPTAKTPPKEAEVDTKPGVVEPRPTAEPPAEVVERRPPKRPVDSWIIFREAFEPKDDATCVARWTGDNRLEVHTENIQRLTIDLTRLPEGAPTKGPWNLQIDDQGIELTGFRPKVGYTGKIRDLVRGQNGKWSVDKKKRYRPRIGG